MKPRILPIASQSSPMARSSPRGRPTRSGGAISPRPSFGSGYPRRFAAYPVWDKCPHPSGPGHVVRQVLFTNKAFWRNPASAFFTFAFPLMFLVIFTTLFGEDEIPVVGGVTVSVSTFYVAAISAFSVISACYTNIAITVVIPNADASPAIVNASILPILFLSDIFIPFDNPPAWVDFVGKVFPVRHFSDAMQATYFSPTGGGFRGVDLLVMAVWGLLGLVLAARYFSWEPRK